MPASGSAHRSIEVTYRICRHLVLSVRDRARNALDQAFLAGAAVADIDIVRRVV
jgi:hypothetical protein